MTKDQQVAEYWNSIATDFDSIYTGDNRSPIAKVLDHILRKDMYGRFDWVLERSGDVRGKTICDIGCGSGRYVAAFAKRGAARVTGVDVAPDMIKLAHQLVEREGVAERCEFVTNDVLDWETSELFDETITIGFWDYIERPLARLRRIRAMTGERFLSAWPRFWTWRMPVRKVRLSVVGCPVYFYRRPEIDAMLREAGFDVVHVAVVGKLYCVEARPRPGW
jgi:SAM-dependent methyltransferase